MNKLIFFFFLFNLLMAFCSTVDYIFGPCDINLILYCFIHGNLPQNVTCIFRIQLVKFFNYSDCNNLLQYEILPSKLFLVFCTVWDHKLFLECLFFSFFSLKSFIHQFIHVLYVWILKPKYSFGK